MQSAPIYIMFMEANYYAGSGSLMYSGRCIDQIRFYRANVTGSLNKVMTFVFMLTELQRAQFEIDHTWWV